MQGILRHATSAAYFVLFIFIAIILSSCAMGRVHSEFIHGAPIAYVSVGDESPVVIFEAGLGDTLKSWKPVYSGVSEFTRVFAYSRAGYYGNVYHIDWGGKRSSDDVAVVLNILLKDTGTPGPYVLVGHSIGGMYMLRFAKLYPNNVAGIILIDSRPKGFSKECENKGLSPCGPPGFISYFQPPHVGAEIRGLDKSDEETPSPRELGDLPVTVIAATEPPRTASREIQSLWLSAQQTFAGELNNGRYVEATGSGHYIHRDDPELVIREIRSMVYRIRNQEALNKTNSVEKQ
jgi:pimeloyl-ACP methyl ester carboxylesterase